MGGESMSTEVISPLAQIIRRAAESKAEGPIGLRKRRMADATDEVVVLADTSDSMDEMVGGLQMRKCEHLMIALKDVLLYHPKIRIISFGRFVREVPDLAAMPAPDGGTPLGKALELAKKYKPRKTIIVSDGCPDSEEHARTAATKLTGIIDAIYCGPDQHPAVKFLQSLCQDCAGVQVSWNGYSEIGSHIRGLIGAPK